MTILAPDGRITIPKAVRERLGWSPGARLTFQVGEGGRLVLASAADPVEDPGGRFAALAGSATTCLTTDAILAATRGDAA